ncbi:PREDICTED: uncharacterized protein LOC106804628 [Priapulus caudatus]|uniref:Uncharacterized protein LOC106804628 n=1 Tax=Priapulus caudatus TaxID=37621 RepID=A0ABM1DN59_PRICU|nr:PREDICTED: uncharacterized protein LOC106804628 [Priapulus caudatus]
MKLCIAIFVTVFVATGIRYGSTAFTPALMEKVITCRGDATDVTLMFDSGFNGEVFTTGFHTDSRCRARGTGTESLTLQIDYNECGVFQNTADQTYMVFVNVAQRQNLIKADDQAFLVTCHYDIDMSVDNQR